MAEHTAPIKGRFLEALGYFNPHTKEKNLEADRVKYWLEKGAQCSDTAHNLLVREGIVKGPKRAVKIKKKEAPVDGTDEKKPEAESKEEAKEELKAGEGKEEKKPELEKETEKNEGEKKKEEKNISDNSAADKSAETGNKEEAKGEK